MFSKKENFVVIANCNWNPWMFKEFQNAFKVQYYILVNDHTMTRI